MAVEGNLRGIVLAKNLVTVVTEVAQEAVERGVVTQTTYALEMAVMAATASLKCTHGD